MTEPSAPSTWSSSHLHAVLRNRFGESALTRFQFSDPTPRYKVIAVGEPGIGKSCLIRRYCEQKFTSQYIATIGIDYGVRSVTLPEGRTVKINFWDMAGDRSYSLIRTDFYADTHGIFVFFDLTSWATFLTIPTWLDEIRKHMGPQAAMVAMVLIGTKGDLPNRVVNEHEARSFSNKHGFHDYFECSAQSGANVSQAFMSMFQAIDVLNRDKDEGLVAAGPAVVDEGMQAATDEALAGKLDRKEEELVQALVGDVAVA
ncbi:P-loop containing nucleoside triphosphate hydrolase protein [Catenaria anguillulae PL171]|uniref:p-loop containing nucleoside triphosphate hydrolase protein n=1 Tax=Catenaria anguillulae PL171 TaxID=765915 RepID=A0A1Y2HQN0_9FUNG|nr:P-loop containing nucleoside triphosphate hydrolase protein [Catenaria anguillulae PL171]